MRSNFLARENARRSRSAAPQENRLRLSCSYAITGWASICAMPISFSEFSKGYTLLRTLKGQASAWRPFNASFIGTEEKSGPRAHPIAAPRSTFHFRHKVQHVQIGT